MRDPSQYHELVSSSNHIDFYWLRPACDVRPGSSWPRAARMAVVVLSLVLGGGLLLGLGGCARGKPHKTATPGGKSKSATAVARKPPAPPTTLEQQQREQQAASSAATSAASATPSGAAVPTPIVLDYGNGWYHTAAGNESIEQIAAKYEREGGLVAELNRATPAARPAQGVMIYIPPTNNRERLHPILVRVSRNPELIPRTPWTTKQADASSKSKFANKQADPWLDKKYARPTILEHEPGDHEPKSAAARPSTPRGQTSTRAGRLPSGGGDAPPAVKLPSLAGSNENEVEVASLEPTIGVFGKAGQQDQARAVSEELEARTIASGSSRAADAPSPAPAPAAGPGGACGPARVESTATAGRGRGSFQWPVQGNVVTRFKEGWRKACHGIEITAAEGTPVRASRAGKVLLAQEFLSYGRLVVIDHGDGFATAYGYNRDLKVRADERVEAGQVIATVGRPKTGASSRLFFQVRRNATPVDPLDYLK